MIIPFQHSTLSMEWPRFLCTFNHYFWVSCASLSILKTFLYCQSFRFHTGNATERPLLWAVINKLRNTVQSGIILASIVYLFSCACTLRYTCSSLLERSTRPLSRTAMSADFIGRPTQTRRRSAKTARTTPSHRRDANGEIHGYF